MKTWTLLFVCFIAVLSLSYGNEEEGSLASQQEIQINPDGNIEETIPTPVPEHEVLRINNRPTPWKFVPPTTEEIPVPDGEEEEEEEEERTTNNDDNDKQAEQPEEVQDEPLYTEDSSAQSNTEEYNTYTENNPPEGEYYNDDRASSQSEYLTEEGEHQSSSFDELPSHDAFDATPTPEDIPRTPKRRRSSSSSDISSSSSSSSASSISEDDPNLPIVRIHTGIEFPTDTQMRTFTLCPSRRAVLVVDNIPHGNKNNNKWFRWLYAKLPFPHAYLVNPRNGDLIRSLEWEDRQMLPFGVSEADDGRIGVTFYQGPLIEAWESHLNLKLTYHEQSLKPALPVFDNLQNMWVPFTIADRLDEEGEGVIILWAYRPDGGRWEVYSRREFRHVKFPHTVHLDNHGRIYVAGLTSWIWIDGTFGQSYKTNIDPTQKHVRLEVYEVIPGDAKDPAAEAEAKARHCERFGGDCKDGLPLPHIHWWGDSKAHSVVRAVRSYEFPSPFETCLWPLFILTGDGYAVCSCYDTDTIVIVKIGDVVVESTDPEYMHEQGIRNHFNIRENKLPPTVLDGDNTNVLIELVPENEITTVLTIKNPYGIIAIGGLQMDPSGKGFAILDRTRRRVIGAPWPWPGLQYGPKHSKDFENVDDEHLVTERNVFNPSTVRRLTSVKVPRSTT